MKYLVICGALLISGCAALSTTELVVSKVVADYCKAPEQGRAIIQAQVQDALKPNTIKIICAADNQ